MKKYIRQPIVAVLGHVDHGKTTLLDYIRGSAIASKEAGAITQHIGATEVPIDTIYEICGSLLKGKEFALPGLLFIDTPGHHAFTTLRARGGALADMAILVIDINDGLMPQSIEALNILKRYKTPFLVVANKIDSLPGWKKSNEVLGKRLDKQNDVARNAFEKKLYDLIGDLFNNGFSSNRYDRISDFKKNVAIVPISAKTGEGIPELLMVLVGLAQRFLEEKLSIETGPAEGTILEVKEEKGLGTTIDAIIYDGIIRNGDEIVLGGKEEPIVTKIRALLKPGSLSEMRDSNRFKKIEEIGAAAGIKISAPLLQEVSAGAPLKVVGNDLEKIMKEVESEAKINIPLKEEGIVIKADTIGSLEALTVELGEKGIDIRKAELGDIGKRDVMEASTNSNPLNRAIIGFNVKILPEIEEMKDVAILNGDVIYQLVEEFNEWRDKKEREIEEKKREKITHPCMLKFLRGCTFRISKPAVIGIRILVGELRPSQRLMNEDGKIVGRVKSVQSENKTIPFAAQGQEVAIALEGAVVGRHIKPEQIFYVDISEKDARKLMEEEPSIGLSIDERDLLDKIFLIKRKEKKFWGM